jgi:hypothetical protein
MGCSVEMTADVYMQPLDDIKSSVQALSFAFPTLILTSL